ncbi:MAG: hypothetical protein HYY40_09665 [Bacteroidetes bacterium]|nr:hypothetical protein [Bacteroidota bacterium]
MKFADQFDTIFYSSKVNENVRLILNEGSAHDLFINYFGVNYNETDIVSVKLYFSFFERPSENILSEFGINEKHRGLIFTNWMPSKRYDFIHQGLTLGLKCYLKNNEIIINKYIHFRTTEFALGFPDEIKLLKEDRNCPGICLEFHEEVTEVKKYYYITSAENKSKIIKNFGIEAIVKHNDISMIEYTESELGRKINLAVNRADTVKTILMKENNKYILDLSSYFFRRYNLYFFAPGYRISSNTKSIYYVPKMVYYENYPLQTINLLMHK